MVSSADCRSAVFRLWGFDSLPAHHASHPKSRIRIPVVNLGISSEICQLTDGCRGSADPATLQPPVDRGRRRRRRAHVAQQAEHFLGKEEVSGSNPDVGSSTAGPGRRRTTGSGGDRLDVDLNVILPLPARSSRSSSPRMVFDQWLRRRQPYQLVWSVGLLWYGISAGTEFLGGAFGWSEPLYRTWYLVRRLRRGVLPRPRDGLPPQPHALRLLRRRLLRAGRALQLPDLA